MSHIDQSRNRPERLAWVDFAKGLCIVAVVALWVSRAMEGTAGWVGYFVAFAKPFRMPDFFLISGLFLAQVIARPWRSYLDTKVVHYLYFLVLWTLLIVPGVWFITGPMPATALDAVGDLAFHLYKPAAMLWFILMLPIYFVVARLLQGVPNALVMAVAALMMVFPLHSGIYPLDWFGEYFVFFFAGHVLAERFFQLADWARAHPRQAVLAIVVWAAGNAVLVKMKLNDHLAVSLVLGFIGISALVMLAALISRAPAARWLNYLGKNSIVVYLGFYLPLLLLTEYSRHLPLGMHGRATFLLVGSIAAALLLHWSARRAGLGFLYERPAWARLTGDRKGRGPVGTPAPAPLAPQGARTQEGLRG
jgi:uncharacterized membrane protein YcfT